MAQGVSNLHYIKIWATLLVLLVISVLGPEIGIKWVTLFTAFGIAIIKAYMVATHFMHLNIEKKYISMMLLVMILLMFVFFFGTAPDAMKHEGSGWVKTYSEGTGELNSEHH